MKSKFNAPGTERLKFETEIRQSAFKICFQNDFAALQQGPGPAAVAGQGITLVHFSAQPEPFLTHKYTLHFHLTPHNTS